MTTKLNIVSKKKKGFPLSQNKGWSKNESSVNAKGGSELMMDRLYKELPEDLRDQFQVICSRVRELEDKKRILWLHDLWNDPEAAHLKDQESRDRFTKLVFVSNYQFQTYHMALGVPYSESVVIKNAIDPIEHHEKPKDKINLIYHTTPHRGLDILYAVYEQLAKNRDDIHLDVYSSFNVYGWPQRDVEFKHLFDKLEAHPNITYHGAVPNSEVREALKKAHIFAYPCTWVETSCISAIEAMSAGCAVVCPNLGALPETTSNFGIMYPFDEDINVHANRFYHILNNTIDHFWQEGHQQKLKFQKNYTDAFYNWEKRREEWMGLLMGLKEAEEAQNKK